MKRIRVKGIETIIFEPLLEKEEFYNSKVTDDLEYFKKVSNIIITIRNYPYLLDDSDEAYTRDLFNRD